MMNKIDVALLTEARYEKPIDRSPYIQNILDDDAELMRALTRHAISAVRVDWASESFNWDVIRLAVFRTTWDYFDRYDEFSVWLKRVEGKFDFLNSLSLIKWNIDKHYLLDLEKEGVRIPEGIFIEKGDQRSLKELFDSCPWDEVVLKPCISGAARHTYRLDASKIDELEATYQELIANEAMMLQAFQYNIVDKGEVSFVVIDGKFTHAILKIAKEGDFRVQDDFGGSVHQYKASEEERIFAEKVVAACPELPLYARVDAFIDNQGEWAVSELEMIEPELWFRFAPHAADAMADGIAKKLQQN